MNWFKEVIFDVGVTLTLILIFLFNKTEWIIAYQIYTPILIILKLLALMGSNIRERLGGTAPPSFFHTLYAMNVLVLVLNSWWSLSVQWLIVWFLSSIFQLKTQKVTPQKSRRATTTKLAHRRY